NPEVGRAHMRTLFNTFNAESDPAKVFRIHLSTARTELQLAAHAPDAALSCGATVSAAPAILGIACKRGAVYATPHALFGAGRTAAKASCACFIKGTMIAATPAVLAVVDEGNAVHAPALAPCLAGRAASGSNSWSLGRRSFARSARQQ